MYLQAWVAVAVAVAAAAAGVVVVVVQILPTLTSLQGALAILLVASQLVAFAQLPEAYGGSEPAPAAGAGPAGTAQKRQQ